MGKGRKWFEVRIREVLGNGKSVKKSKFYQESGPGEAARKYRGPGSVISVTKVSREQTLGIGEFFKLGDGFLKELRGGGNGVAEPEVAGEVANLKRRYYGRQRQKATNKS